jgi:hypothetical protein
VYQWFDEPRSGVFYLAKLLKVENDFNACPAYQGDELYVNGIFEFNITKMIEYIQKNSDHFILVEVKVADFFREFSSINASHVNSVDVSKPVIIAEIAPGRVNLIDGNHRMEKARRMGIKNLLAYKLNPAQHTRFLTSKKAYLAYIEYWNSNLV